MGLSDDQSMQASVQATVKTNAIAASAADPHSTIFHRAADIIMLIVLQRTEQQNFALRAKLECTGVPISAETKAMHAVAAQDDVESKRKAGVRRSVTKKAGKNGCCASR